MLRVLLALVLLPLLAVAAPVPKSLQKSAGELDGVWRCELFTSGNMTVEVKGSVTYWVIRGHRAEAEVVTDGQSFTGETLPGVWYEFRPSDSGRPEEVEFLEQNGGTEKRYSARIERRGDTLRLAHPSQPDGVRPKTCQAGFDIIVYTFSHVEPGKDAKK